MSSSLFNQGVGPTGPTGPTGSTGATGAIGPDGRTVLSGSGTPAAGLGDDGDFYIDTNDVNRAFYGPKTGGSWGTPVDLVASAPADQVVLQAERSTTYAVTTTLSNLTFDETDVENNAAILNHDAGNTARFYAHENGFYIGVVSLDVENTSNTDRTFTIQPWVNDAAAADAAFNVVIRKNISLVITRPLLVYVGPGGLTAGDYVTIRVQASANSDLTIQLGGRVIIHQAKGQRGVAGPAGSNGNWSWQGAWAVQDYSANEVVQYQGTTYRCHTNTTASQAPTDTGFWEIAVRGSRTSAKRITDQDITFTSVTDAQIGSMTTTMTLAQDGQIFVQATASGVRNTGSTAGMNLMVEIDGEKGKESWDHWSNLYDNTYATHSKVLVAGTYTVKILGRTDFDVFINEIEAHIWAVED